MLDSSMLDNLDAMSPDELRGYAVRLKTATCTSAADDRTRNDLYKYATTKAHAMELRQDGKIQAALNVEALADLVYGRLPKYAKW